MIYCDTSFLASLYVPDNWHGKATAYYARDLAGRPLFFNPWQRHELRHTLRTAVGRWRFTEADCRRAFRDIETDLEGGILCHVPFNWTTIFDLANELSSHHAVAMPAGTVDFWHVAFALNKRAESFVTFDADQARLARAAGLRAPALQTS